MSNEKIEHLNPNSLHPFENNPFQSVDENEYNELRDSVMEFGIITPLIVNKSDNSFEIISGHRRWQIAKELNLGVVPVYVKDFSKEEAVISFVDCNLSREKILPSEKARAYKMKHDAMKKQGARTEYHIVKQEQYPIYDGIHDAIISEEVWLLAQKKRKATGVKSDKLYSLEHQHLLSGIVCCPGCGQSMYGSVNRKRKKDGTFYRDYWYYACKHRLELDGHKCTYRKQIHQEKVNSAVEEFISNIVKNPKFEEAIKQKINSRIDTAQIETEIEILNKKLKQLNMAKEKLGKSMDMLDVFNELYNKKYDDMQMRLDSIYHDIDETEKELSAVYERLENVRKDKISQEKVYQFLLFFDIIYPKFTDAEKKEFLGSIIECVEINPEPTETGQILKKIKFRIPVNYVENGENSTAISVPTENLTVETVCLLTRKDK